MRVLEEMRRETMKSMRKQQTPLETQVEQWI